MGYAYLEKKEFDSAIAAFKKGVELDQNDPRPKEGLQEAETLKANPSAPLPLPQSVRDELKAIFSSLTPIPENGDLDTAIKSCRENVAKTPLDPKPYISISELLLVKGDPTAAMMSLRKAFELNPDLKDVLEPLTTALFDKKDYDSAWREVTGIRDKGFMPPPQLVEWLKKVSGRSE
jgi:tetratricopeptide (TPR) repeat protein